MNRKGQTLVIFIIILPVILIAMAYLVDTGLMLINKSKLDSTSKIIIDKYYDYEGDIDSVIQKYLKDNNLNYTDYKVKKDNNFNLKIDIKIASIFGKVVGLEEYEITSNITGYKENDKLKFKNE